MGRLLEHKFRIVVLLSTTACLSMMLANILTLNFTILCMTEEKFHWENFTIDLGIDVFERIDFQSKERPPDDVIPDEVPDGRTPGLPGFPSVEIPGIRVPAPGFNWQSFRLARQNPQLFLKLLKTVIVEASRLAARRAGDYFDPRNIDFERFRNGFNITDLNRDVIVRLKDYILRKVELARHTYEILDAEGRNISQWRNVTVDDIHLKNITWNGVIKGEIRILDRPADYYYTASQKALLFSVVAIGALLAIGFVSYSIRHYGCRKTFTVVGITSVISTALCPCAASLGFTAFVICRCFQGIGFAACMPVIGAVTSAWAKLTENGLFNGVLTCFIQLAPAIAMPISGFLCVSSLRWPFVFYVHALLTLIFIVVWWFVYRDSPSESTHVQNVELRKIHAGKVIDGRAKHNRNRLPMAQICSDKATWAVWVAAVGNMFAIETLILFNATYINRVLHYSLVGVGVTAALPTLLQFVVKLGAGVGSDRLKMEDTKKVKLFNSVAFIGMGVLLLVLALFTAQLPSDGMGRYDDEGSGWRTLALIALILATAILGFNTGGFFKSATLVGRQYAYFINMNVQIIMCVAILTSPFLVYALAPDHDPIGWAWVYVILAALLFVCNAVFCAIGSAEPAPFTKVSTATNASAEQSKPIIKVANNEST